MKKIEKLKFSGTLSDEEYRLGAKVNEIIDVLNRQEPEWLSEKSILRGVFGEDTRDEKDKELDERLVRNMEELEQEEDDMTTMTHKKGYTTETGEDDTTGKQEEWVEEILSIAEEGKEQGLLTFAYNELLNKVSQLLSERTREAKQEGRREYAHELLDDYYDPDRDSVEIDIDVLQKEFDLISNSEITSKQRQTEEILEEGYRIMAEDEARMKDEIALETYKQATTEKQEGEGEELDLKKEIAKIFAEEEVALLLADSLQEKLVDFISQLLSERTFSKEELEWILSFIFGEGTRSRDGMGMKVLEKISKLLNEKE